MDQPSTPSVPDPHAGRQPGPAASQPEATGAQPARGQEMAGQDMTGRPQGRSGPSAAGTPGSGTGVPVEVAAPAGATPAPAPPIHVVLDISPDDIGGRTVIGEQAVARVAGVAARSVDGVYALGSGASRALGAVREAVGGSGGTQGVSAEVGETEAAIDVTLVAVYGVSLLRVADEVRAAVYAAVEQVAGLSVVEVNVTVADVHLPDTMESRPERAAGATAVEQDG